jgi:hypothetical protein
MSTWLDTFLHLLGMSMWSLRYASRPWFLRSVASFSTGTGCGQPSLHFGATRSALHLSNTEIGCCILVELLLTNLPVFLVESILEEGVFFQFSFRVMTKRIEVGLINVQGSSERPAEFHWATRAIGVQQISFSLCFLGYTGLSLWRDGCVVRMFGYSVLRTILGCWKGKVPGYSKY